MTADHAASIIDREYLLHLVAGVGGRLVHRHGAPGRPGGGQQRRLQLSPQGRDVPLVVGAVGRVQGGAYRRAQRLRGAP